MKYFIYIVSFLYTINSFSQTGITKDVESGDTDTQNASSLIEVSNNIKSNATAVYKSGKSILLSEGFFANGGSDVFMSINENVTSSLSSKSSVDLLDNNFSVHPSPSNGIYNVQSTDNIISYAVVDLLGNQIITGNTTGNDFAIDITNFSSGFYLLELLKENGNIIRKKIIKN